jgi:hypothetical protein
MKVFKKALAAVLAGFLAVGSLSVSAYTVKADEAVATDEAVVIEDNSAFEISDVTKVQFLKKFEDEAVYFGNEFITSPKDLVTDMQKAWDSGHGISWLHNTMIILETEDGLYYVAGYDGEDKEYSKVKAHIYCGGIDVSAETEEICFVKTTVIVKDGMKFIELFDFLTQAASKMKYKGTYIYGGTKIDSVVANPDKTFSVKMDNQAYTFFEQDGFLYAKGDVTDYSAIKVWQEAGVLKATYIAEKKVNVYRIYNPNSGEHFYTVNKKEAEDAVKAGWKDEGVLCQAPVSSSAPVYRVFNPNARDAGSHHFTISEQEKKDLVKAGWVDEGIAFYSVTTKKGIKLYRAYNPNDGGHNFTVSKAEQDSIVKAGWKDEGLAWYVYPILK